MLQNWQMTNLLTASNSHISFIAHEAKEEKLGDKVEKTSQVKRLVATIVENLKKKNARGAGVCMGIAFIMTCLLISKSFALRTLITCRTTRSCGVPKAFEVFLAILSPLPTQEQ